MFVMSTLLKILSFCYISLGIVLFIIFSMMFIVEFINRKGISRKHKNSDLLYQLCKVYMNYYDDGDGYWIIDTEMQMYKELEKRLKK